LTNKNIMMNKRLNLYLLQLIAAGLMASFASEAPAVVYINEIFSNPPGTLDTTAEYIELRGTPSASLTNDYLILVDTVNTGPFATAGVIQQIFNLSTRSLGTNGFLTIRQKGNGYSVAAGTTDLVNSGSGVGFGSGFTSNIGASDSNANGEIQSGFTAMLINVDVANGGVAPSLNFDLDQNDDGLDFSTGRAHWTILDSIGFTDVGEATNNPVRYYGKVNFGPEPAGYLGFVPSDHLEPGATYTTTAPDSTHVGHEIEYLSRWGNSTGQTAADWNVADLSDNPATGYNQTHPWDFRQSCGETTGTACEPADDGNINTPPPQPTPPNYIDSTQGVPFGTIMTNTLGKPNFLSGDYNKDGVVSTGDYVIYRKKVGTTGSDLADNPADGNHDYVVNAADHTVFRAHFGQPASATSFGSGSDFPSSTIPEPTGLLLGVLASLGAMPFRRRRITRVR
jgi:hypothetical protein